MVDDVWASGDAYERYVGRWSRRVAASFVPWLGAAPGLRWLDVGCGTGALTAAILGHSEPNSVLGVDPSPQFLAAASSAMAGEQRVRFQAGDAQSLPVPDDAVDVVVSGLALNFVAEPNRAVAEFARVTVPGGCVAAYVWDYSGGMQLMRYFWDAASALHAAAGGVDEERRFPMCRPGPLMDLWVGAGLANVVVQPIEIPTVFVDFDDYWQPFLGGQGPAPAYAMSLNDAHRDALRELLRERLPVGADGSISLTATAWAVRGRA